MVPWNIKFFGHIKVTLDKDKLNKWGCGIFPRSITVSSISPEHLAFGIQATFVIFQCVVHGWSYRSPYELPRWGTCADLCQELPLTDKLLCLFSIFDKLADDN